MATNLDSLDSGSIPVILTYTGANDPNAYVTLTAKADGTDVALADKIDITLYASDNGTADGNHTAEANVMWSGTLGQLLTLNPSDPNGAVVQHTSDLAGTKTWIDWQVSGRHRQQSPRQEPEGRPRIHHQFQHGIGAALTEAPTSKEVVDPGISFATGIGRLFHSAPSGDELRMPPTIRDAP